MADRKDRDVIEIEELEDIGETDKDMYKARKSRMKEERGKFYSISRRQFWWHYISWHASYSSFAARDSGDRAL